MSMQNDEITLSVHEVEWVREALLIGLTCLGDIEERCNAHELFSSAGVEWPEGARPTHPTGTSDCVSKFAMALTVLSIPNR